MTPSTQAVSPLRQRMLDDMRMRKLQPRTQDAYIRAVCHLAAYLKRSPDTATVEDLRNFQLHLVDAGASPTTLNATLTGLKFFFDVTLGHIELMGKMQPVKLPRTLPVVLSREEVSRLLAEHGVRFKYKDYRAKGRTRHKTMTLAPEEFMRRFLLHVLPSGFHRIRHYGLLANGARKSCLALARELLQTTPMQAAINDIASLNKTAKPEAEAEAGTAPAFVCRHCGRAMAILQCFVRGQAIRAPPAS